jgi:hypothetical protein
MPNTAISNLVSTVSYHILRVMLYLWMCSNRVNWPGLVRPTDLSKQFVVVGERNMGVSGVFEMEIWPVCCGWDELIW